MDQSTNRLIKKYFLLGREEPISGRRPLLPLLILTNIKKSIPTPTRFGAGGPGMCKFVYMLGEGVFRQSFPPITPCAT